MIGKKIVAGNIPAKAPTLKAGAIPKEKHFTFSLKYWNEPEFFGIGDASAGWLVSLITRLRDLSKEKVERFFIDPLFADKLRYHVINWDQRNVPIKRPNLTWLPNDILKNEDEFPIYQIYISTGVGRIHGFWDSEYCFNVILLDPLHNLQPSGYVGYAVRPTLASSCAYSTLRIGVEDALCLRCDNKNCKLADSIRSHLNGNPLTSEQYIIIAGLTLDVANTLQELHDKRKVSISEIVAHGITFFP